MDRKLLLRITAVAAATGFVCTLLEIANLRLPGPPFTVQPSMPPVPLADFVRATNNYPQQSLRFFAADSLFVIAYLVLYAGLYALTAERAATVAALGLGAGIFGGLCDALENAFFISYASLKLQGEMLTAPALPLLFVVANLKWMGALVAFAAFGLAWPRRDALSWAISAILVAAPVVGAASVLLPDLLVVLGITLAVGMALFAVYFWRASLQEPAVAAPTAHSQAPGPA